jgi:L-lysine exporter family protein LysE/ArgO
VILAIIIGFVTGWLVSMPIGPVNASAISRTLRYNYKYGIATGLGAALMDLVYCGGAAQIHQFLRESPIINLVFQLVGFGALVYLGIKTLRTARQQPSVQDSRHEAEVLKQTELEMQAQMAKLHIEKKGYLAPFLIGVVLYASNVAAVPEWIFISAFWRGYGLLETGVAVNAAFALGAGLGTAGWFIFLVRYIDKRQRGFKPRTLARINLGSAIALLGFGIYFGYQIVFVTDWNAVTKSFRSNSGMIPLTVKTPSLLIEAKAS